MKNLKVSKLINIIVLVVLLINSFVLSTKVIELENTVNRLQSITNGLVENEGKIVEIFKLKYLNNKPDKEKIEVLKKAIKPQVFLNKRQIDQLQITRYSSLDKKVNLTEKDIDLVINDWDRYVKGGTPFKGKGAAFIQASKATGLDPVYLLAHAAWETGWGRSQIAKEHRNYYGIAAYDHDPGKAYHMGSSIEEGIINGAKWIAANYYNQGYTSLNSMIYGGKMYASDKDKWIAGIQSIMRQSYKFILHNHA